MTPCKPPAGPHRVLGLIDEGSKAGASQTGASCRCQVARWRSVRHGRPSPRRSRHGRVRAGAAVGRPARRHHLLHAVQVVQRLVHRPRLHAPSPRSRPGRAGPRTGGRLDRGRAGGRRLAHHAVAAAATAPTPSGGGGGHTGSSTGSPCAAMTTQNPHRGRPSRSSRRPAPSLSAAPKLRATCSTVRAEHHVTQAGSDDHRVTRSR